MNLRCIRATIVPGYGYVDPDDVISLTESEVDKIGSRIERNFVQQDGTAVEVRHRQSLSDLSRDELIEKARAYGLTPAAKTQTKTIIKMIQDHIDEQASPTMADAYRQMADEEDAAEDDASEE